MKNAKLDRKIVLAIYCHCVCNWWLEDQPIIERLEGNASVSFMGEAVTTAPVTSSTTSVSTTFDGTIGYCAAVKEPTSPNFPLGCAAAPVECQSSRHQVTFTRK